MHPFQIKKAQLLITLTNIRPFGIGRQFLNTIRVTMVAITISSLGEKKDCKVHLALDLCGFRAKSM